MVSYKRWPRLFVRVTTSHRHRRMEPFTEGSQLTPQIIFWKCDNNSPIHCCVDHQLEPHSRLHRWILQSARSLCSNRKSNPPPSYELPSPNSFRISNLILVCLEQMVQEYGCRCVDGYTPKMLQPAASRDSSDQKRVLLGIYGKSWVWHQG